MTQKIAHSEKFRPGWILIACLLLAGQNIYAKKLDSFLTYTTFYSPESGPYIETYLTVVGSSVKLVRNENNKYQGTVEVTMLAAADNTSVIATPAALMPSIIFFRTLNPACNAPATMSPPPGRRESRAGTGQPLP